MSKMVAGVPVNQQGLRALGPYFMVEKIRWNENGTRVTGRRPFVCEAKRSARKAEKVRL